MTDFADDLAVETSNVKFKLADPLGRPIIDLRYEVRQMGKVLVQGSTDAQGDSTQFQALIGFPMSISVQRFMTSEMKLIREVTPWTEVFPIVLVSGKVLESTITAQDEGAPGDYRRKTYVVRAGDTVTTVASQQGCDLQELLQLNEISADAELADGQVLKIPLSTTAAAGSDGQEGVDVPGSTSTQSPDVQNSGDASGNQSEEAASAELAAAPVVPAPPPVAPPEPAPHPVAAQHSAPPSASIPVNRTAKPPAPPPTAPAPPAPPHETGVIEIVMSKIGSAWTSIIDGARGLSGSPKTVAALKCPGVCLKLGDKDALVEELNIRLTGFGGTVQAPSGLSEFTAKTEAAVKQFQRDFMKVPETGKVCGSFLVALDLFRSQYPIDFAPLKCSCGRCHGFGTGQTDSHVSGMFSDPPHNKHPWPGVERPGIHRAIVWAMRASMFYTSVVEKELQYKFLKVSSSYRCWYDNSDPHLHTDHKVRHTINHMGDALDVQFTKGNSTRRCQDADVDTLREKVFVGHMGAQMAWSKPNRVSLERASDGATTWVHMDVRTYDEIYKDARFYAVTQQNLDGDSMVEMAKRESRIALTVCAGLTVADVPVGPPTGAAAPSGAASAAGKRASNNKAASSPASSNSNQASTPIPPPPPITGNRIPISDLTISAAGLAFIRAFEDCSLQAYDDSAGFCTIGWGHQIAPSHCASIKNSPPYQQFKNGIDQATADKMFKADVAVTEATVKSRVQVPMFQHEYDALVSLIFNLTTFKKCPNLLSKLNTKNYDGCCKEFADITSKGNPGLVVRRAREMKMFTNCVYDSKH